jgi:hypothetical protein
MKDNKEVQYQYDMVVNIVAEMVVEYMKSTDRDIDKLDCSSVVEGQTVITYKKKQNNGKNVA